MPIYEYCCKNCDHRLDALQKMSDAALVDCPACGKPALKRLLSAPKFRLKGKGWYETDFKKDNQRNISKSDSEVPKTDKTESKSDKKAEPAKSSGKDDSSSGKSTAKKEKSDT